MKYMRKIDFSQKNQNPVTYLQYRNNYLENSIDNFSIQIFIFSLRLLFVIKEKKFPLSKNFPFPHLREWANVIWKNQPVVTSEQNFVEHS